MNKNAVEIGHFHRTALFLVILMLILGTASAAGAPPEISPGAVATIELQRQAAALHKLLIPFYSVQGADVTELFFASMIADPIEIDLYAVSLSGEQLYLGHEVLPPSRNRSLNLRRRLADAGETFAVGNLRLEYVADAGALQSWAAVRSGRQSFEIPSVSSDQADVREVFSFWDTAMAGPRLKAQAQYYFTNTTDQPIPYKLTLSHGSRVTRELTGSLGPLQTRVHTVNSSADMSSGWLALSYEGSSGTIIGAGVMTAGERVAYLPLVTQADMARGPRFEILRVPGGDAAAPVRTGLTLFNTGDISQSVAIDRLAQKSGALLGTRQLSLAARQVATVNVEKLFGRTVSKGSRLRVRASSPSMIVDGAVITAQGEVLDMAVFPASLAHRMGTYPIPDLDRYIVRTTIVNLGEEEAEVLAQYFWDGGSYSVPILHVPAGGTTVIDPAQLAANGKPDLLQRTFDRNGKHLMLKWTARKGSTKLLGRTEVQPRGGSDGFGFNCFGCCWQYPRGGVVPGEVEVGLGESASFEAGVYYDTCTGTVGPYYPADITWSSVPWPFGWNYHNLTASDAAEDYMYYDSVEETINPGCNSWLTPVGGAGKGDSCKKVYNRQNYNENQTCAVQTSNCTTCRSCCTAIYNVRICKNVNRDWASGEKNACDGECLISYADSCPD